MKQIAWIVLTALLLGSCAAGPPVPPAPASPEPAPSAPPPSVLPPGTIGVEHEGVTLAFLPPEIEHAVLGVAPCDGGFALLYEEAFPEEYNRQFSADDTFYSLKAQLFDELGGPTGAVSSNWSNSNRTETADRLTVADGLLTFETSWRNEAGRLVTRAFRIPLEGEDKGETEIRDAVEVASADGALLQYLEARQREGSRFRLTLPGGERLELPWLEEQTDMDFNFSCALSNAAYGVEQEGDWLNDQSAPSRVLAAEIDVDQRVVRLSTAKLTCTLDFAAGRWSEERRYPPALLGELRAQSPDGRWKVFAADSYNMFEGPGGCDYVLAGPAGEPRLLFAGSNMDELWFVGNDLVWANRYDSLPLYDVPSCEPSARQLAFDFGWHEKDLGGYFNRQPARLALGTAYDSQNGRCLVAWRDYEPSPDEKGEEQLPVTLSVFDRQGALLREIDAGFTLPRYKLFSIWNLELRLDGGAVTLWDDREGTRAVLSYL